MWRRNREGRHRQRLKRKEKDDEKITKLEIGWLVFTRLPLRRAIGRSKEDGVGPIDAEDDWCWDDSYSEWRETCFLLVYTLSGEDGAW